jgi:hypothetical protein
VPPQALEFSEKSVFLNIPYDDRFRRLYLAYITGLIHLGLKPRATIEIPGGRNRLDKILELIRSCRYSIHDLSRVELDRTPPTTPRFNMPLPQPNSTLLLMIGSFLSPYIAGHRNLSAT